jgi:hypothetical protein
MRTIVRRLISVVAAAQACGSAFAQRLDPCDVSDCSESPGGPGLFGDITLMIVAAFIVWMMLQSRHRNAFIFGIVYCLTALYIARDVTRSEGTFGGVLVIAVAWFIGQQLLSRYNKKINGKVESSSKIPPVAPAAPAIKVEAKPVPTPRPPQDNPSISLTPPPADKYIAPNLRAQPVGNNYIRCNKCGQLTDVPSGTTKRCNYCGTAAPLLTNKTEALRHGPYAKCIKCGQLTMVPSDNAKTRCGYCGESAPFLNSASPNPVSTRAGESSQFQKTWKLTAEGLRHKVTGELIPKESLVQVTGYTPGYEVRSPHFSVVWVNSQEIDK